MDLVNPIVNPKRKVFFITSKTFFSNINNNNKSHYKKNLLQSDMLSFTCLCESATWPGIPLRTLIFYPFFHFFLLRISVIS